MHTHEYIQSSCINTVIPYLGTEAEFSDTLKVFTKVRICILNI